jgi:hypothetical protein
MLQMTNAFKEYAVIQRLLRNAVVSARLGVGFAMALVFMANHGVAVDLVKDGQPLAVIVAEVKATPNDKPKGKAARPRLLDDGEGNEELAVQILVEWIKKITGAELPVASAAPAGKPVILVGKAAEKAGLKLDDILSPTQEGLRIQVDGQRVLIAGQNETATTKAACRFLEELGCRYFMEGSLGEVYPRTPTLSAGPMNITEKPGLLMRNPKGPSWRGGYWKLWNGAGGLMINHAHAWGRYLPAGLFKEHPEYFALDKNGQRKDGDWLCTSNPDARRFFAARVIETIKRGTRNPSISPPDGRGYCQCPACKAQDDPKVIEPSSGEVSVANRYVDFFDAVARQVARECPAAILSFYCYADYTQPTTLKRRLAPNLCAVIAPIRYCRLHPIGHADCPSRKQQVALVQGWHQAASRLGYYNYMYNLADATLPFFKFSACKADYPFLAANGVEFMTMEVLSNWHIYGPHLYLGMRLAYHPQADAAAIMNDYWEKFYGPRAAPFMNAYWLGIDQAVQRLPGHAGGFFGLQEIYTPEFLRACERLLVQAKAAAQADPIYAERVALHTAGFQSAVDYQEICAAMGRGDFPKAWEICARLRARIEGLAAKGCANREYGAAYLDRFLAKHIQAGVAAVAAPARVVQVLPEDWRLAFDDDDQGVAKRYHEATYDDADWKRAATWTRTLDSQGLARTTIFWYRLHFQAPEKRDRLSLFFTEVDGYAEVYVNGRKLDAVEKSAAPPSAGPPRKRTPFEVDISGAVKTGDNLLAVRVDNRKITELFLGGILRPVVLIAK